MWDGSRPLFFPKLEATVASISEDRFVVVWRSGWDGFGKGVYGRIYSITGDALTNEIKINTRTELDQDSPSVSRLSNDRFVVVWRSFGQDGDLYGVYGRIFNITGNPLTSEFQANTHTALNQGNPTVSSISDDKFVVVWDDVFVFIVGGVEVVVFVVEFPKGVVKSVDANFDEHEEVPGLGFHEVLYGFKVLFGHLV